MTELESVLKDEVGKDELSRLDAASALLQSRFKRKINLTQIICSETYLLLRCPCILGAQKAKMAPSMKSDTKGKDRSLRTAYGEYLMMNVVVIAISQTFKFVGCQLVSSPSVPLQTRREDFCLKHLQSKI